MCFWVNQGPLYFPFGNVFDSYGATLAGIWRWPRYRFFSLGCTTRTCNGSSSLSQSLSAFDLSESTFGKGRGTTDVAPIGKFRWDSCSSLPPTPPPPSSHGLSYSNHQRHPQFNVFLLLSHSPFIFFGAPTFPGSSNLPHPHSTVLSRDTKRRGMQFQNSKLFFFFWSYFYSPF